MTEAEILTARNEVTAILVSVVSASLTVVSAYVVGLWTVLRHAPVGLRLIAFAIFSLALAFFGGVAFGLHHLLSGTEHAWSKLTSNAMNISGFGNERPEYLFGLSLYEAAAMLGGAAFLALYLALFAMTFAYDWSKAERRTDVAPRE